MLAPHDAANRDRRSQRRSEPRFNVLIMAVSFPDLSKAEGLKALNDHLAPYSYIDG